MAEFQGTYSADKVIITVGPAILSGFADGDFVSASYAEDRATPKAGADGGVGVSRNASKLGTIVVTLSATSAANDALSALFNLDAITGNSVSVPISVTCPGAPLSVLLIAGCKCHLKPHSVRRLATVNGHSAALI